MLIYIYTHINIYFVFFIVNIGVLEFYGLQKSGTLGCKNATLLLFKIEFSFQISISIDGEKT